MDLEAILILAYLFRRDRKKEPGFVGKTNAEIAAMAEARRRAAMCRDI